MVNKQYLLLLIVISLVCVRASDDFFFTNQPANIIHSVRTNDAPTSTAQCNITMFNPNHVLLVQYQPMTYNSSSQTFNFTLPANQTSVIGNYCYDITCIDSGLNKTDSFCIPINPIGKGIDINETLLYGILFFLLCIICGLCIWGGYSLPVKNERNEYNEIISINWKKYLKMFCIAMAYLTFVAIIFIAWNISYGYLQLNSVGLFFQYLYSILLGLALPLFIIGILIVGISLITDIKYDRLLKLGMTEQ